MSTEQPPNAADDFKLIKGIGRAMERRLHQAGIRTYTQLAGSTPAELASIFAGMIGMSVERIVQENWIGQARSLSPEPASAERQSEASPPGNGQHYATFTVELLLDDRNAVRRTRVAHVQGTSKDTWAGWQEERLIRFVAAHAGLQSQREGPAPVATSAVESAATATVASASLPAVSPAPAHHAPAPGLKLEPVDLDRMTLTQAEPATPPAITAPAAAPHHARPRQLELEPVDLDRMKLTRAEPAPPPTPPQRPSVPLAPPPSHSAGLQVIPAGAETPRGLFHHDESFNVHLTLDLPETAAAEKQPLNYKAIIYAESLGGGLRQVVGERQGSVAPAKALAIDVPGHIATPGTYRLEAEMSLRLPPSADWNTSLKGSLLHVY